MAYASTCDVAALTRTLLGPLTTFSESSSPTSDQVTNWLSSGCAIINTRLAAAGYAPIPTSSVAYDLARQINALFAAWMAERSKTLGTTQAGENTRADMFKKDYQALLDMMLDIDLANAGVSSLGGSSAKPYAGGISLDDKSTDETNSDRVKPRFKRGMMRDPNSPSL